MDHKLTFIKIARWIIRHPPLLKENKEPIAANPYSGLSIDSVSEYEGSLRLGFVYQELCRQLFLRHPSYSLLADEVQLFRGKETLGAVDFLLDHHGRIEHWEVAMKFYLLKDGLWYGPDSRDRLDKKLDRMLTHQLKMSQTDAFEQRFPELNKVTPRLLMHGRLYINPFENETIPTECLNYALNLDNIAGSWCYHHQYSQIKRPLFRLSKLDWITGRSTESGLLEGLPEHTVHCQDSSGHFWLIVPDSWPTRTK